MKKITVVISDETFAIIADIQHFLAKQNLKKMISRRISQGDAIDHIAKNYWPEDLAKARKIVSKK